MKTALFAFIALAAVFAAGAQNVDFNGNDIAKDICAQYGMKDDKDAIASMDKICNAAGIPNNFVLLPCPNVNNCYALYKDGIAYIVYDITFFNKVESFGFTTKAMPTKKVDWAALTILAHELGHHLCQHTTNRLVREKYTPVQMELQADEFAGTVMYKLGATLARAQEAFNSSDVPDEATLTHPARKDRLAAVAKGYNSEMKKYADRNGQSTTPPVQAKDAVAIKNQLQHAQDFCNANNYQAALEVYKSMDEADLDAYALSNIGYMYLNGRGTDQDYSQAKIWYEKAVSKGDLLAMSDLGFMYENGLGVNVDYSQSKALYEQAANAGLALAMNNLGHMYALGRGVPQDYGLAKAWYEKAAYAGSGVAMYNIASLYESGSGVAVDFDQAKAWYQKAADAGYALAMTNLGFLYQNGNLSAGPDYAQAKYCYEQAAQMGEAMAMSNIGVLYLKGFGVAQDYTQARLWFEKAANAGNAQAMSNVGTFFEFGYGVEKDYTQAKLWYDKACAAGYNPACDKARRVAQ